MQDREVEGVEGKEILAQNWAGRNRFALAALGLGSLG